MRELDAIYERTEHGTDLFAVFTIRLLMKNG